MVLPLLAGPKPLMNRNILYTAVTRGKKCVTIVGSRETVQEMIHNKSEQTRYSSLRERLVELEEKEKFSEKEDAKEQNIWYDRGRGGSAI